ncbi:MAG: four helix bundle protein [Kiritimatiellae bacterium]|nr:four helix bundle protein [Kiritimatiellia bacterium]
MAAYIVLKLEASDQVARSVTAIGANYREANRAKSREDFLHKITIVAKEASESEYWLLLLHFGLSSQWASVTVLRV